MYLQMYIHGLIKKQDPADTTRVVRSMPPRKRRQELSMALANLCCLSIQPLCFRKDCKSGAVATLQLTDEDAPFRVLKATAHGLPKHKNKERNKAESAALNASETRPAARMTLPTPASAWPRLEADSRLG